MAERESGGGQTRKTLQGWRKGPEIRLMTRARLRGADTSVNSAWREIFVGILGKIVPRRGAGARRLDQDVALLRKSPLVDPVWYRRTYTDLSAAPLDVARHYLEFGAKEWRNPSENFNTRF